MTRDGVHTQRLDQVPTQCLLPRHLAHDLDQATEDDVTRVVVRETLAGGEQLGHVRQRFVHEFGDGVVVV